MSDNSMSIKKTVQGDVNPMIYCVAWMYYDIL